jgi:alkylhydroperoxidase family enzyme
MDQKAKPSQRLGPLPPAHSPELKEEFDSFLKTLGFVPNSVLTMQRKPKLAKAFVQMQRALWDPESKVDRGLKRLLAHAASRTASDPYSMAHTASGALHFGIEPEKLAAVREYKTSSLFSAAERTAFDLAVAASANPNAVSDATFVELRKFWTEEQIVEIVGVIAMAGFLARWNVTMATPIESEPNEVGEKHLKSSGWEAGAHLRQPATDS